MEVLCIRSMRSAVLAVMWATALVFTGFGTATAAEVKLTLKGGGFSVTGKLTSFGKNQYVIESRTFGSMTLDASRFDCEGDSCPDPNAVTLAAPTPLMLPVPGRPTRVLIHGSSTIGNDLMPALIRDYAARIGVTATQMDGADPQQLHFKLSNERGQELGEIDLQRTDSSMAFQSLLTSKAHIGMAARRVQTQEVAALATNGVADIDQPGNEHVLALDGLVLLVAPENSAVSISIEAAADIFSGKILDWAQLGLPPGEINVYVATDGTETRDTFDTLIMKPVGAELRSDAKRVFSHNERSDLVAHDPLGITFAGLANIRKAKPLNIADSCGLITRPSEFSVKTEEYPLTRRLYLYTQGEPTIPLARGLLQFALSTHAQDTIANVHFVNQRPATLTFEHQGGRIAHALNASEEDFNLSLMREFIQNMSPARRLSTTFRFAKNSNQLDTRAQQDIQRLADLLGSIDFKDRALLLVGYADAKGPFNFNLQLSNRRAEAVRQALLQVMGPDQSHRIQSLSYGELAPVACNTTEAGRTFNRRVEAWVQ